jgi:hypothetical protein
METLFLHLIRAAYFSLDAGSGFSLYSVPHCGFNVRSILFLSYFGSRFVDTESNQSKFGSCFKFFFSALNSSPAQLLPKIFLLRAGDRTLDSFFLPPLFPALGHLAIYGVLLVFLLPPPHHIFTDSLFFLLARP